MINTLQFSVASALTAALLWIGCSVLVIVLPGAMWQMTAHMLHVDLAQVGWAMSWTGAISGLVSWSVFAGLAGAILSALYNKLLK